MHFPTPVPLHFRRTNFRVQSSLTDLARLSTRAFCCRSSCRERCRPFARKYNSNFRAGSLAKRGKTREPVSGSNRCRRSFHAREAKAALPAAASFSLFVPLSLSRSVLDLMNTGSVKITDSRYPIEVTSDQRERISGRIDLRAHRASASVWIVIF